MSNELQTFDQLKADISLFVAPVLQVTVTDFKSSQDAIDAGKTVKKYASELEKKRKEIVGPLNDRVKLINTYAKGIEEPLLRAEQHIKSQLARFAEEQEKVRQAELKRIEDERREAERKAQQERQRLEDELESRRQAELDRLEREQNQCQRAAAIFGGESSVVDVEAEATKIDEQLERERLESEARFERERIERDFQAKQAAWDADQFQIKNARKTWKCQLLDITQVPKEFLIVQLNEQAVLAAARAGVQIPGVKTWQEMGIAFGSNTRVTRTALASEGESA